MAEYNLEYALKRELFGEKSMDESAPDEKSDAEDRQRDMLKAIPQGCNSFMTESVFDGSLMYAASGDYHLYAIDTRKGEIVWKFRTGGAITHSPSVYNGVVYIGSGDHTLYALDARTGAELWRFRTGDIIQMKPLVLPDRVVIGSYDKNIYAISHDGRELWRLPLPGFTIDEPLYLNGVIYFGATDGRLHAISADGREVWSYFAANTYAGAPSFVKDTTSIAFVTWDGYVCNITRDGKLLWKFKCDGSIPVRYSWNVRDGVLYVGSGDLQSGTVHAIDVRKGSLLWKFPAGGRIQGVRFCNGLLLCTCIDKNIYALDKGGKLVWKFQADGPMNAPPGCLGGLIYQGSISGHIYCLTENGELVWKLYFPGQPVNIGQLYSPVQRLVDKVRSLLRWWKPEKAPSREYETKSTHPQLTVGAAAYKMSEPYKSEVGYKMEGPPGYEMKREKKKDWRDPFAR